MKRIVIATAAFGLLAASAAMCQTSGRPGNPAPSIEGLSLGASVVVAGGITVSGPGMNGVIRTNRGEGAGIQIAWGFGARLVAFVGADVVRQSSTTGFFSGSFGLAHAEIGGRYVFSISNPRLAPYITALVGTRGLGARSDEGGATATLRITGGQVGGGGGVLYAISPSLSLDAALLGSRGRFGKAVLSGAAHSEGTLDVNSTTSLRARVGFVWHP